VGHGTLCSYPYSGEGSDDEEGGVEFAEAEIDDICERNYITATQADQESSQDRFDL